MSQVIVLAKHLYVYQKSVTKGPSKKKKQKKMENIYRYFWQKKILFLLYISFADVDHDIRDDQRKKLLKNDM